MRLNLLLLLMAGILLAACSDSSDYAMPPEYDYTPQQTEAEKAKQAPSSSLLDIAISAGSDDSAAASTRNDSTPTTTVAAVADTQAAHSQQPSKPVSTAPTVAVAKPITEAVKPTSKPTVLSSSTVNKPSGGIKELDFSAKENAPAKVTTVKLENTEVTQRGQHSQSLYAKAEQGRFHKANKHGSKIAESSNSWLCVIDNKNGLLWEGKSQGKWRNAKDQYALEGDKGSCQFKSCAPQAYISYLNEIKLCGRSNWRLPSKAELTSLVSARHADGEAAINLDYFPNTQTGFYWSSTTFKYAASRGWAVDFASGFDKSRDKSEAYHLRLVSGN